ncbi:MAG TPA: enoyl-CoA hydratase-related protein, partial [Deinococcales bacterium]|nr:enoyl-CoA hydratase-related protein [Deinococcales bacterium]
EKPVITAVNGVAAGAGASLALAGDIRVWSDNASLVEAFSRVGLVPDSGSTWMLPRLVGWNRAFDLMVHADKVTPDEALRMGVCERVYPAAEFEEKVRALAENLAAGPTRAFGLTKRALNHAASATLAEALDYEAHLQEAAGGTADHREGVAAFAEKRRPAFRGE